MQPTLQPTLDQNVFDILSARGFVQNSTDADALRAALASPLTFYAGFDPTADSLHVGHLLPIMAMRWLQAAGHRPIVVLGGGTAMVGDPTGKDKTREFLTPEQIEANLQSQKRQFGRYLDLADALVLNNGEWLLPLNYIAFLRDIGQHFSVNRMLSATGAQQRLERGQGYSFIEFNYHLLQSYDYLFLHQRYGCSFQLGGDDQWFNIIGGADLIRRETGAVVHAMTLPLLLTADGKKMGKTEGGAVWIDAGRLPPYDYYQYWINVHDADVGRLLRLYTFLPLDRIAELERLQGADIRQAKEILAFEATALAHGEQAAQLARATSYALFSAAGSPGADSADLPSFAAPFPVSVVDALVGGGLADSKGAARRLIQGGGVRFGEEKIADVNAAIGQEGLLWAGKKRCVRVVAG